MAFPPEFLDDLRARLPIADVVARRVKLTRRGREHVGLCPFHKEKSPSFTVSDDKGFYHCFGCGAHGDVIGFVMRTEGLSFPETIEKLAGEASVPVPQSSPEERQRAKRQSTLHDVMERAALWYEAQLRSAPGSRAHDYLTGRGLKAETIARFRLGFAPDARSQLKSALLKEGIEESLLIEAGLLARREDGGDTYDRFRDRVIFPITDPRGRVIAFGGRALGEAHAKYLNSPDTPLFHKGRVLFGLAQAREPARSNNRVLVVEGYMDAIALAEAGFPEVVAPLGTALTEEQIELLWKLAPEPVLCFDGDAAGQRAALRAATRALPLLKPGHSLRFALVPPGEDPDSLVRRRGPGAIKALIDEAAALVDVIWRAETEARHFDTPERRAGLRRQLEEIVRQIPDRDVQDLYRREYAGRMFRAFGFQGGGVERRPFRKQGKWNDPKPAMSDGEGTRARIDTRQLREKVALLALIRHPHLVEDFDQIFGRETFITEELEALRRDLFILFLSYLDIEPAELERRLGESGHAALIDHLTSGAVRVHAGFARPDATIEEAREGLREVWKAHYHDIIQDDHDRAVRAFMENPCDQTMKSLETLRKTMEAVKQEQDLSIISSYLRAGGGRAGR
ncbi:MAG: DNA primase [Rhodospirillaceae bacterium]|nr:DNA primase [Rhodospirillaceae bacterium]